MNILYIGSSGALSLLPFEKLLASEHSIVAVGVNNPVLLQDKVIALENASLALSANQNLIPLIDLTLPLAAVLDQCRSIDFDVILMSCYGSRLADDLIRLADRGCFNLHPSILPKFRGPEPIFWQMRAGVELGVSWHKVVHGFDAGDLVVQATTMPDDGASFGEITTQLAELGAGLMPGLLDAIARDEITMTQQEAETASYYPYPKRSDFIIDIAWSAQHAYNFMCATEVYGYPYLLRYGNYRYMLAKALDFDNNLSPDALQVQSDRLYIPCREGVLIAAYTDRIAV